MTVLFSRVLYSAIIKWTDSVSLVQCMGTRFNCIGFVALWRIYWLLWIDRCNSLHVISFLYSLLFWYVLNGCVSTHDSSGEAVGFIGQRYDRDAHPTTHIRLLQTGIKQLKNNCKWTQTKQMWKQSCYVTLHAPHLHVHVESRFSKFENFSWERLCAPHPSHCILIGHIKCMVGQQRLDELSAYKFHQLSPMTLVGICAHQDWHWRDDLNTVRQACF